MMPLLVALFVFGPGSAVENRMFTGVDPDETLVFYSPYLYWEGEELKLVLRGRLFELESTSFRRRVAVERVFGPALLRYMGKRPDEFDESARKLMHDRLLPFLYDGESLDTIELRLESQRGSTTVFSPLTDAGGNFSFTTTGGAGQRLSEIVAGDEPLNVQAVLPADDRRIFAVTLPVPPRHIPLLVISDVDDTVRIADVTDRRLLIERTFMRAYEPVQGLARIYQRLSGHGAWFHYVSGSPWQLASIIDQFLKTHEFPPAVLHCRQISWDFWNSDPLDTLAYKVHVIRTLLKQFPESRVLLVGDSGEHDPEVYSEVCRSHGEQVAGVWIRRVSGVWDPARLDIAAKKIGADRVRSFGNAMELDEVVKQLIDSAGQSERP